MFTNIADITLKNILFKIIIYSTVLLAFDTAFPHLYGSLWPITGTVIVLTAIGAIADVTVLPRLQNLPSLLLGYFGMTAIIWLMAQPWPGTHVRLAEALLLALWIAPFEFILHKYLFGVKTV